MISGEGTLDISEQIAALGARADSWFEDMDASMDANDKQGQVRGCLAAIQILWRYEDLKNRGYSMLNTLLNPLTVVSESDRVAALLYGFKFAAKLQVALYDEMMDTDAGNHVDGLTDDIVVALAGIGSGRAALVPLLDVDDARVSATAGRYLIDLMPDRVIPVLQEIEKGSFWHQPAFEAHMVLLTWELERKGRFNALQSQVVSS